ncbi:hypothetical protein DIPPA_22793 [Diplonema papillatum]|nr:hypothetical protein DIPPA_18152 [Diplonema papillatum]KAJ9437184.1 hypothetical protein DIPPA_18151 [Diplonema papillatum]KAJ9461268.1 hypothetical protein DIPPA_22793 [Diplonema papillatum]
MVDAAARIGCPGRAFITYLITYLITYPTQIGAHVVRADPPLSSASLHRFSPFRATTANF